MKRKISATDPAGLVHEIATLHSATPADLKSRWRALYGTEPPPRISRDLLIRALAYKLQEEALGGLKPSTRRCLGTPTDPDRARIRSQARIRAAARLAWHSTSGDRA